MKITFGDKFAKVYLNALYDERLTRSDVLVLTVLDRFADNDTHTATVSRATIASVAKMSNNTLSACLTRLEESGYVIIQERHSKKDGSRLSNAYTLTVSEYAEVSDDMAKTFSEAMCEVIEEVENEEDVVDFSGSKEEWCVKSTETPKKTRKGFDVRDFVKENTTTKTTSETSVKKPKLKKTLKKTLKKVKRAEKTTTTTTKGFKTTTETPVKKSWNEKTVEEHKAFFRKALK